MVPTQSLVLLLALALNHLVNFYVIWNYATLSYKAKSDFQIVCQKSSNSVLVLHRSLKLDYFGFQVFVKR